MPNLAVCVYKIIAFDLHQRQLRLFYYKAYLIVTYTTFFSAK